MKARKQAATPTWGQLCEELGYPRRELNRWKQRPGAPTVPDLATWRAWLDKEGLGQTRKDPNLNALKVQMMREDLRSRQLKNAQLEGSNIPADEVRQFLQTWTAKLDLLLTLKLETEAPARCIGKQIADMRVEMRTIHDEIRTATRSGLRGFAGAPQT